MIAGIRAIVLAAALLAGCAGAVPVPVGREAGNGTGPEPAPSAATVDKFEGVPGKYRDLAASAEKGGDLRRALLFRKVVHAFSPNDEEDGKNVERVERKIRSEADRHYRDASALLERGEMSGALMEFLAVLVLDPDHEAAFLRVKAMKSGKNGKNGGAGTSSRTWTVRDGDDFRKIAGEVYHDPGKAFLIPYFNGLPDDAHLSAGSGLLLPGADILSSTLTEKVRGYSHPAKEGNGGRTTPVERKDAPARNVREADAHYAAGMRHFLGEDLDGAIREWEKTLSIDPSHPKARRDIEKARRLKGKLDSAR